MFLTGTLKESYTSVLLVLGQAPLGVVLRSECPLCDRRFSLYRLQPLIRSLPSYAR